MLLSNHLPRHHGRQQGKVFWSTFLHPEQYERGGRFSNSKSASFKGPHLNNPVPWVEWAVPTERCSYWVNSIRWCHVKIQVASSRGVCKVRIVRFNMFRKILVRHLQESLPNLVGPTENGPSIPTGLASLFINARKPHHRKQGFFHWGEYANIP